MVKDNPIYRHDLTLSIKREYHSDEQIEELAKTVKNELDEICEKYVFQCELTGESNYHFQVRLNLKTELRWRCNTLRTYLEKAFYEFYNIHVTPTSANCRGKFDYVMKEETRHMGPWADKPMFLGKSIIRNDKLLPWHNFVLELMEESKQKFDWRTIYHIYDESGNSMKSTFCRYMLWHHESEVGLVNVFGTPSQINASLVQCGPKLVYIIDIPRSYATTEVDGNGKQKVLQYHPQWPELCLIIERLKDGMLVNSMYGKYETLLIDPPLVLVFSNWPLEQNPGQFLSQDRISTITLQSGGDFSLD